MNKKKIIIISILLIIVLGISYHYYRIKTARIIVKLEKNREVEVYDKVKISKFIKSINGKLDKDSLIDTSKVGTKKIEFTYINDDNIRVSYEYNIKVKDTDPPIIGVSNYSVNKGYDGDLSKVFFCGD